jgi:predicted ATPase
MIRKIQLSNFMAHANTQIELADGLNVIVGPNNIGKSTIATAIKIVSRNSQSNFVMQHDQKECSINVETSEGHRIQWNRKKSPSYVINGQIKDRLGRGGTPPELDETLRLSAVEFEDKDFEPHFGDQKSPIFLINRSPSQIAQFFSTTSDAERLVNIQRLHQRKKGDAQTRQKWLNEENTSLTEKVEALESVPDLCLQLGKLEQELKSLDEQETQTLELQTLIRQMAAVELDQQWESLRLTAIEPLQPVPYLESTDFLESVVERLKTIQRQCQALRDLSTTLRPLIVPPTIQDERSIEKAIDALTISQSEEVYWSLVAQAPSQLQSPPLVTSTVALTETILKGTSLELETSRFREVLKCLDKFPDSYVPSDTTDLNRSMEQLLRVQQLQEQADQDLQQTQQETQALDLEAERWLAKKPHCKTCGAKITLKSIRREAIDAGPTN